jgi:DNA-binding NarL/FixJ family response regulator
LRRIRVLVVDDHEIVRIGLRTLLGREQDMHVVGMAASGEETLPLVDELKPDVLVVDYSLGPMSGVEVCERVTADHPETSVIMLSTYLNDEVIQRSIQAGAKAYVYKDVEGRDLKRMIRTVAKGQAVLDPKVAGRVMHWASNRRSRPAEQGLSARETEILRLVARGATNVQISEAMGITLNTVKTYLRRAMEKLGCHSRAEAVAAASRRGLL